MRCRRFIFRDSPVELKFTRGRDFSDRHTHGGMGSFRHSSDRTNVPAIDDDYFSKFFTKGDANTFSVAKLVEGSLRGRDSLTEVRLVKLKIKEGKIQKWLEWCEELKRRSNEVLETLKNEGTISEACFLSEDENSIYYFMESNSFEKAYEVYRKSSFPIDKEHKAIQKETLESVANLKVLFNFHSKG